MLVVLTSHPIQYQAPLWRALSEELGERRRAAIAGHEDNGQGGGVPFEVWFLTDQGVRRTEDKDFGKAFAWDVDLLAGYPHRFLELRGVWDLRSFRGIPLARPIGEMLRQAGATALWTEGWRFKVQWDAVGAARRMGIPVFLRGETSDKIAERGGVFGFLRRVALGRLFGKVDHFLAIGRASRRFYQRYQVPEAKLVDAPYCVDNEFFRRETEHTRGESRAAIRAEWKISEQAKVVLFCGKFMPKKRPIDVVRAVERLRKAVGEKKPCVWHLLFVGSGDLGGELRSVCDVRFDAEHAFSVGRQSDERPPATFTGFLNQSEICHAYAVADVLVLPSEAWETWGLVVNEATAAGLPTVVSSSCGCAEDFAASNPHTFVFEEGDVEGLAWSIREAVLRAGAPEALSRYAEAFAPRITAKAVAGLLAGPTPL